MSLKKVLILCQEVKYITTLQIDEAVKKVTKDITIKWQSFDDFQEGKRNGTFDGVFAVLSDMGSDDLEMSEEFYKYYAVAPIFYAFVVEENENITKQLKEWNDKVIIKASADSAFGPLIAETTEEAKTQFTKLLEEDVKPAFKKFDKDGSGSIDKAELKELSKDLGNELNDGDLETALKDLDLNGDGVIDQDEFSRWYFSGMKTYGSNKRSMLKFQGHASKILQKTQEQAKLALVGQELKVKKHKFAVSFNDPKDGPGTTIDYNVFLGSKANQACLDELSGWLNDTTPKERIAELNEQLAHSKEKTGKVFMQLKVSSSDAEAKAAKLNELKDKAMALSGMSKMFNPMIKAEGNMILVGIEIVAEERQLYKKAISKFIEEQGLGDLFDMFKEVDQSISFQVALGADLKSIFSEEEKETPLLKHLAKGFKVSSQVTLVSNLKKAIAEMLKSDVEEEQQLAQTMMIAAPAFIFGINADMDIEFDDFEEIAEHPMAAPAMATFEQLFEGMLEDSPDSYLTKKLDLSGCEEPAMVKEKMSLANEFIEAICDLDDPSFNNICIKVASADLPISTDTDIHSEGLGRAVKLALKAGALKLLASKAGHIFDKELEEIYHD